MIGPNHRRLNCKFPWWVLVNSTGSHLLSNKGLGFKSCLHQNQLVFYFDNKEQLSWSGHYRFKSYRIYPKNKKFVILSKFYEVYVHFVVNC